MTTVLLVIHLLIALAMVGLILIQKSEGGALSGLGGGGNMGGMASGRGSANLLTRATAILATCFVLTSLTLAIIASNSDGSSSILDEAPTNLPQPQSETLPPPLPLPPVAN